MATSTTAKVFIHIGLFFAGIFLSFVLFALIGLCISDEGCSVDSSLSSLVEALKGVTEDRGFLFEAFRARPHPEFIPEILCAANRAYGSSYTTSSLAGISFGMNKADKKFSCSAAMERLSTSDYEWIFFCLWNFFVRQSVFHMENNIPEAHRTLWCDAVSNCFGDFDVRLESPILVRDVLFSASELCLYQDILKYCVAVRLIDPSLACEEFISDVIIPNSESFTFLFPFFVFAFPPFDRQSSLDVYFLMVSRARALWGQIIEGHQGLSAASADPSLAGALGSLRARSRQGPLFEAFTNLYGSVHSLALRGCIQSQQ